MAKSKSLLRDWSRGKIRYELEKAGETCLYAMDRHHGLPLGTCSNSISVPHRGGEEAIACALNRAPAEIWPSRYDENGNRLRPQPAHNYRQSDPAGHRQNRRAA